MALGSAWMRSSWVWMRDGGPRQLNADGGASSPISSSMVTPRLRAIGGNSATATRSRPASYLPGIAAAGMAGAPVILCEALIDALTFWEAGFRDVTAAYGVEGFTETHLAVFATHGIKHVLITYDRDEAGDRGAAKTAERLGAAGIGCWRVLFPKGMDANATALKLTLAAKSLGLLLRQAVWMGDGEVPARPQINLFAPLSLAAAGAPTKPAVPVDPGAGAGGRIARSG